MLASKKGLSEAARMSMSSSMRASSAAGASKRSTSSFCSGATWLARQICLRLDVQQLISLGRNTCLWATGRGVEDKDAEHLNWISEWLNQQNEFFP